MKRRNFLKYIGVGGAGFGAGYAFRKLTKPPGAKLIPYIIPPEHVIPAVPTWYSSLCSQCGAGCGVIVKIIDGRARKLEGNPLHPINRGKLCARGQAALQVVYNPDRIQTPLKRTGDRGSGSYTEISWDEAISTLSKNLTDLRNAGQTSGLYLMTSPVRGHLGVLLTDFLSACGSSNHLQYDLFDHRNLLYANRASMGTDALPYYDIAKSRYLLSFGADFSTNWLSSVNYSLGYGTMREGGDTRGRLVQVEPRMSLTGMSADEWVPARPGTESILALAIAKVIVDKGYYRGGDASAWKALLDRVTPKDADAITDVDWPRIERIAKEFTENRPSLAIGGDNLSGYENGISGIVATNILNHLAGNLGPGGTVAPNPETLIGGGRMDFDRRLSSLTAAASASKVKTLLVYNTNPVFTSTRGAGAEDALKKIPFIASFSSFMDETTALADLILPSHTPLEEWGDGVSEPSVGMPVTTLQQPVVSPVFQTRGLGDTILSVSKGMGGGVAAKFKWNTYEEYLKDSWRGLYSKNKAMAASAPDFEHFWINLLAAGGWWPKEAPARKGLAVQAKAVEPYLSPRPAAFEGSEKDYPFYLVLYPQAGLLDGRNANLPWLQELPDPVTTVVWDSWVEMNPKTAAKAGLQEGDVVSVESPYGKVETPLFVNPAIRPDTIAMPIGQGHRLYGRYAQGRGVNPIEILPNVEDPKSGALALNSTRVKVSAGSKPGKLVKLAGTTRDMGRDIVKTISPDEFLKIKKEVI